MCFISRTEKPYSEKGSVGFTDGQSGPWAYMAKISGKEKIPFLMFSISVFFPLWDLIKKI